MLESLQLRNRAAATWAGWLGFDRSDHGVAASVMLLFGLALRVTWNILKPTSGATGEASNVAIAIAQGRGIADAYRVGQGPTAHLLPISPGIGGLVYGMFGIRSLASEIILSSWALALMLASFILLLRVFRRLGTPEEGRLLGLAAVCLLPCYIAQEAVDYRLWEGGLAVFLVLLSLDRLLAAVDKPPTMMEEFGMAALASLLFFVHPVLGLAIFLCFFVFAVRHLLLPATLRAGVFSLVALAVLITPWALRNRQVLGQFVLLRSNAGLELALATDSAMIDGHDRRKAFIDRLTTIHPTMSDAAYAALQHDRGEVAYARIMGRQAQDWIRAHPWDEAELVALHLRQVFAPQSWMFQVFGSPFLAGARAALVTTMSLLGLLGIAAAIAARRAGWGYIALVVLLPAAALAPFQPVPRYTYVFYLVLSFCCGDLVLQVLRHRTTRTGTAALGVVDP